MKKFFLVILCFVVLNNVKSQKQIQYIDNFSNLINASIDSCDIHHFNNIYKQQIDSNKFLLIQDNKMSSYEYRFPKIKSFNDFEERYKVASKCLESNNYYSKLFARDILDWMLLSELSFINFSKLEISEEQKQKYYELIFLQLIDKSNIVYQQLPVGFSSFINKKYITEKMKLKMVDLFNSPYYTEQQASQYVNSINSKYNKKDTINNNYLVKGWRNSAKKEGKSLTIWLDSMQSKEKRYFKTKIMKTIIGDIYSLEQIIRMNDIVDFAPTLEHLIPILDSNQVYNTKITLAHFHYKDYDTEIVEDITKKIDYYLHRAKYLNVVRLDDFMKDLLSINTQNSFFAISPLLLCKEKYVDAFDEFNYNQSVLEIIQYHIINLPITCNKDGEIIYNENSREKNKDVFYDKRKSAVSGSLFDELYKWMINNKGNYELLSEPKE